MSSAPGTARRSVTVPAAGASVSLPLTGLSVIVEKSPVNTPAGCPVLRIGGSGGATLPAYTGARYNIAGGFQSISVEGTTDSAGLTLYLLVVTTGNLQIEMPGTVA